MSIEAAAEALAPEPVTPPETPETVDPTPSDDELMQQIWDKNQNESSEAETVEAADEDQPVEELEEEPTVQEVSIPSDMPAAVREKWADIPADAREAIQTSYRDFTTKLGEQGRLMNGIKPIQDVLVEAARKFPAMADRKPNEVAQEVFKLAEISQNFTDKPMETMMGLIKQHGLEQQMAQVFNGKEVTQDAKLVQGLQDQVRQLQSHIEKISNPDYLRDQVTQITSQTQTEGTVNEFAAKAEHWSAVEAHMPAAIEIAKAKLGDGAAPQAVLTEAYELAVGQFLPDVKAKPEAAEQAAQLADPEKTKAQIKAKSVNVQSKSSGKARELTEDELMEQVWAKHNS